MPRWMRKALWKRGTNSRKRKAKGIGNQGVSFVEVIVSMLIMAIAVVPLLGSFMMSLRVNMKSRQAMSATIVAQNVMECVKEYANDKVVTANVGDGIKNYLPDGYQTGFTSSGDGFTLNNVREGVNDYQVVVKYDKSAFATPEHTGLNDREIPDLTTLDAVSTMVVCPAGVVNGSLENAAKTFFFDQWVAGQWHSHEDVEGYSGPTEAERNEAWSDIALRMTSELTIEVSGTKEAPKAEVVLRYLYDGMGYSAYSTENEAGMKKLDNIYIFYDPLKIEGDASSGYRIEDMVQIKNTGGFSWSLFFAVQESSACLGAYDAGKLSGPVFAMDWPYMGEPIELYCSTKELKSDQRISMDGTNQMPDNAALVDKKSLVATATDGSRMQKVTVKVYRQGTGEMLATMETDVLQ